MTLTTHIITPDEQRADADARQVQSNTTQLNTLADRYSRNLTREMYGSTENTITLTIPTREETPMTTPTATIWNSDITICASFRVRINPRKSKVTFHATASKVSANGRVCRYQVTSLAPCGTRYLPHTHFEVADYGTARKARAAARRMIVEIVRNHPLPLTIEG